MVSTTWSLLMACIISISLKVDMVSASQDIVKKMSAGFGKALESCKTELSVGDHIIQDFYNFWREDYQLLNRDFGCILLCMAAKHDLIDENMKMHHGNAHAFAKTHGADDDTAKQLVTMLHECETQYSNIEDFCNRVVEMAKCFRTKIHQLKWAPPMEVLIEEVMTSM